MRIQFVFLLTLAVTMGAAQTKVSGTVECSKPDQQHSIDVGDRPNHSYVISQGKCTWTKPIDIGGVQAKEDLATAFIEAMGDRSRTHRTVVTTFSNGDKMEIHTQGSATMQGNNVSENGTWIMARGTGKVNGFGGEGAYKCTGPIDKVSCEIEGEYHPRSSGKK